MKKITRSVIARVAVTLVRAGAALGVHRGLPVKNNGYREGRAPGAEMVVRSQS